MPLWAYRGIVTEPPSGSSFMSELDLGCKWFHPTRVQVAGFRKSPATAHVRQIARLLPEGTPFTAVAERIDNTDTVAAHILLDDGTDVGGRIRNRTEKAPTVQYGWAGTKLWRYPAVVRRLTDADTARVSLDLGVRTRYLANVRVAHVNAPERGTAAGQVAAVWADRVLRPGTLVDITSTTLDKYQRVLGTIRLADGMTDYGSALVAAGHAVAYEGGKRS